MLKFTVIITAYNRKEYLMEAVISALNQTLQKEHFEIFVIKNFVNEEIDLFLNKHLIRNFYDPSPYWNVSLSNVLANATGDVICFLDDDDDSKFKHWIERLFRNLF